MEVVEVVDSCIPVLRAFNIFYVSVFSGIVQPVILVGFSEQNATIGAGTPDFDAEFLHGSWEVSPPSIGPKSARAGPAWNHCDPTPLVNEHRPWQIGVGRLVSIKHRWFSGSMLIYWRIIFAYRFFGIEHCRLNFHSVGCPFEKKPSASWRSREKSWNHIPKVHDRPGMEAWLDYNILVIQCHHMPPLLPWNCWLLIQCHHHCHVDYHDYCYDNYNNS